MNIDRLFKKALAKGFSDVQIFLVDKHDLSIEIFDGELEKYEIADSSTLTIKAVYNNKMATHVTEIMGEANVDDIIEKLLENAKAIDSLDEAIIYPGDKEYAKLDDLYNPKLEKEDVKNKIELAKALDKKVHEYDERVKIVETMYSESSRKVTLQNTLGLKLQDAVNSAMFGGQVIVKDDKDQRTNFDLLISNDFADFEVDKLADSIVKDALLSLGAKPVKTSEYELVFDRSALATLLYVFQGIFSADNVHKNMSLLKGKLNTVVGSDKVTIVDDPFMKKSSQSRSFDDEGVATKYKELIKNGVLTTYLHNLVSAKK
ncbi:MAG: TldD/PmbA family protein, partial [Bacilli bacterium]|nr:TldD/PmbA family protein [Bacilli bacterium]MBN2696091.1 TldD/PmbA family protein [Bacilli bacterium]